MTPDFGHLPLSGWFPGHMLKAGREMQRCLKLVDLVVELLDARVPLSSRNPAFRKLLRGKPVFLAANKADLADPQLSRRWTACLKARSENVLFVNSTEDADVAKLIPAWSRAVADDRARRGAGRALNRPVRVMIAGIPNVGKSTMVNRLRGARKAAVAPTPGVTRQNQWIPLKGGMELLDTPGVLWPRIRSKVHELKLALVGAMRDETVGVEILADYLWTHLREQGGKVKWGRYDLEACPETPEELQEAVARRRGLLLPGDVPDLGRSAAMLLKDFRDAKLGRLTLETPEPAASPACDAATEERMKT